MGNIRIIPRLDIKGPNVIKGVHMEGLRIVGNPKDLAYRYFIEGADEIIYMDNVASLYQRNIDFDLLKSVCENIFIPFTVGGGIRSISDINNALRAGADKIAINTYAIRHPEFIEDAVKKFGSQCIVLSIEAKKIRDGQWEAYTDGGREHTGVDVVSWAKKAIELGVGEIMIMSIDRDGTKKGYEHKLIQAITSFSPVPVITHGGAMDPKSIHDVIAQCHPDAISASTIFHYKHNTIGEIKQHLQNNSINVRTQ